MKDLEEFRDMDPVDSRNKTRKILKEKWQSLVTGYKGYKDRKNSMEGLGLARVVHIRKLLLILIEQT